MEGISECLAEFSLNLMRNIGIDQSNAIFSPISIATTLAMTLAGAGGNTKIQIRSAVFGNQTDDAKIHSAFKRFITETFAHLTTDANIYSIKIKETSLKLANGLFLNEQLVNNRQIKSSFIHLLQDSYQMDSFNWLATYFKNYRCVKSIDFSKPEIAAKLINDWVANQTNGNIKNIVDGNKLASDTAMILINAIHFKARWNHDCDKGEMVSEKFYQNAKDSGRSVEMLKVTDELPLYSDPNGKFNLAILPYANTRFNFFLLVPTQIGEEFVHEQLQNLTGVNLLNILNAAVRPLGQTELWLPIFNVESSFSLKETLMNLGITDMFCNEANFSGISTQPLSINSVVHKAVINVDEFGTEASASTSFEARCLSCIIYGNPPVVVKADRPFIMGIWEKSENLLLFMGKISNPQ